MEKYLNILKSIIEIFHNKQLLFKDSLLILNIFNKINIYFKNNSNIDSSIFENSILNILQKQKKYIDLNKYIKNNEYLVVIGDLHGDLLTLLKIFNRFDINKYSFLFLGDYVDRGDYSLEVLMFLLFLKIVFPEKIFLLTGNHEAFNTISVSPSDFWHSNKYNSNKSFIDKATDTLPLIAFKDKTLFLHGSTPENENIYNLLEFLSSNSKTSELFKLNKIIIEKILWGDFVEEEKDFIGYHPLTGRPQHGSLYFNKTMKNLGFEYLIRGHQQNTKGLIYNNRCLTIFSSDYYKNFGLIEGIFVYVNNNFSKEFNKEFIIQID